MAFERGNQDHSVGLPPGPLGISGKDAIPRRSYELQMAQEKIGRTVRMIRRVHLAFTVLGCFAVLFLLLKPTRAEDVLQVVAFVILFGLIYFGLRYRREWVVTLVLLFSAYNCLRYFLLLVSPAENIKTLFGKVLGLLLLLFYTYTMMFFLRAPVRTLFGDKDTLLF